MALLRWAAFEAAVREKARETPDVIHPERPSAQLAHVRDRMVDAAADLYRLFDLFTVAHTAMRKVEASRLQGGSGARSAPLATPSALRARARLPRGTMNATEARYYAEQIRTRELLHDALWWGFEPWTLRIGERCSYTPDFVVIAGDFSIECHEVKAGWRASNGQVGQEASRVRLRAAASRFPFLRFFVAAEKPRRSGWEVEEIRSDGMQASAWAGGDDAAM